MLPYLIQGFLLGLAYVAPIGTQNIFVINTALSRERKYVLITAAIVAFFDVSLSLACFFGIGALISRSVWLELFIILVGGLVVLWIGIGLLRDKSQAEIGANINIPISKVIVSAMVVTWCNPQAIIDGTMLLGASKAAIPPEYGSAFIVGCASASLVWWFGMSSIVNAFKAKFSPKILRGISIVCGAFIVFYSLKLLYSGVQLLQTVL